MATTVTRLQAIATLDTKGVDRGVQQMSSSVRGAGKDLKQELGGGLNAARSGIKGFTSEIGGLGGALQGLGLMAVAGGLTAIAKESVGLAMQVENVRNTFTQLGGTANDIQMLRNATRGLVSDLNLMQASNQFVMMGLAETSQEAADLAQIAATLGQAMGQDVTSSMENLALMLANQSIQRLDSFGISSGKVRTRMNELKSTMDGISNDEAFKMAFLEEAAVAMERVGDSADTMSAKVGTIQTAMQNAKAAFGEWLIVTSGAEGDGGLTDVVNSVTGAFQNMSATAPIIDSFGANLREMHAAGEVNFGTFSKLNAEFIKVSYAAATGQLSAAELADVLYQLNPAAAGAAGALDGLSKHSPRIPLEAYQGDTEDMTSMTEDMSEDIEEQHKELTEAIVEAWEDEALIDAVTDYAEISAEIMADLGEELTDIATSTQDALVEVTAAGGEERVAVTEEAGGAIAELEASYQAELLDMAFQYNVDRLTAEADFQAEYNALMAAGKTEEAEQLKARHEHRQAVSERNYLIEQQLQERNLIIQKIQQLQAYKEELQMQQQKIKAALAAKIMESQAFQKMTYEEQLAVLRQVDTGAAKELELRQKIQAAATAILTEGAKGRLEMVKEEAMAVFNAVHLAALPPPPEGPPISPEEYIEEQIKKLEQAQKDWEESFLRDFPFGGEISYGDMIDFDEGGLGDIDTDIVRTTEPATRALSDVVQQIDDGVEAALSAIENLIDFDIPAGVEEGLDRLGEFFKGAVTKIYGWLKAPSGQPDNDQVEDLLEEVEKDIGGVVSVMQFAATDLSKVQTLADADFPDLNRWATQVNDIFTKAIEVLLGIHTTWGQTDDEEITSDLKIAAETISYVGNILSLTELEFGKIREITSGALPDLDMWGARVFVMIQRATEVLLAVDAQLPDLRKASHAVSNATNVLALTDATLEGIRDIVTGDLPNLDTWGARVFAMIQRSVEVLMTAKYQLPDLETAAGVINDVKNVLELAGEDFGEIESVLVADMPDLEAWGARVFAMIERATGVLTTARLQVDGLEDAARVVDDVLSIMKIVEFDMENVAATVGMEMPDMNAWGTRFFRVLQEANKQLLKARDELDDLDLAADISDEIKAILDAVLQDFTDINKLTRMQMPDLDLWGQRFHDIVVAVHDELVALRQEIGTASIRLAADIAADLKEMLSILDASLDFEIPTREDYLGDLRRWLELAKAAAGEIKTQLEQMDAEWQQTEMTATTVAQNVAGVLEVLGAALTFDLPQASSDPHMPRTEPPVPVEFLDWFYDLKKFIRLAADAADVVKLELQTMGAEWEDAEMPAATAAQNVMAVLDVLSVILQPEMPKATFASDIRQFAADFRLAAETLLTEIQELLLDPRWAGQMEDLGQAARDLSDIMGLLDIAYLFGEIQVERPAPSQIESVFNELILDLKNVTPIVRTGLKEVRDLWDVASEGLAMDEAIEFTEDLNRLWSQIRDAVTAAGELAEWGDPADDSAAQAVSLSTTGITKALGFLSDALDLAHDEIVAIQEQYGEILPDINETVAQTEELLRGMARMVDLINALPDASEVNTNNLAEIIAAVNRAMRAVGTWEPVALPEPAPIGPGGVEPGPIPTPVPPHNPPPPGTMGVSGDLSAQIAQALTQAVGNNSLTVTIPIQFNGEEFVRHVEIRGVVLPLVDEYMADTINLS